jgi:hypothetical protein
VSKFAGLITFDDPFLFKALISAILYMTRPLNLPKNPISSYLAANALFTENRCNNASQFDIKFPGC